MRVPRRTFRCYVIYGNDCVPYPDEFKRSGRSISLSTLRRYAKFRRSRTVLVSQVPESVVTLLFSAF